MKLYHLVYNSVVCKNEKFAVFFKALRHVIIRIFNTDPWDIPQEFRKGAGRTSCAIPLDLRCILTNRLRPSLDHCEPSYGLTLNA